MFDAVDISMTPASGTFLYRVVWTPYGGPFCQDKKSACVKIQNPPSLLVKNLEGQVRFLSL